VPRPPSPSPAPEPVVPNEGFYRGDRYAIQESVGYLIRKVLISFDRRIDARMQAYDLTAMQWKPLLMIKHGIADTAATIARESDTDTGAVTRMVDRLEAKGLLERRRSDEDRRVMHLDLTEAGEQITERIPYCLSQVLNEHLSDFSPEEFAQLKSLLRRMLVNGCNASAETKKSCPGNET